MNPLKSPAKNSLFAYTHWVTSFYILKARNMPSGIYKISQM
jgi:hypothetical protein